MRMESHWNLWSVAYYQLLFWHRFISNGEQKPAGKAGFDLVVGNPPYGNSNLDRVEAVMGTEYSSYLDLYSVFI
jgi:hypothetical protein